MIELERRIAAFAKDREVQEETLGLIKAGNEMRATPEQIAQTLIANVLLRFHGIQITPPQS